MWISVNSKNHVAFLIHIILAAGIHPDSRKTGVVKKMKEPTNVSELRNFLRNGQVPRKIDSTKKGKPLCNLLSKKNSFIWDVEQSATFQILKEVLFYPPMLAMYCMTQPETLKCQPMPHLMALVASFSRDWVFLG